MELLKWFCLAAVLALSGAALAADPAPRYNLVELQAEAQREVPNDTLSATENELIVEAVGAFKARAIEILD